MLGCTHYPLLSGVIQLAMGEQVTLVSSAEETSKDVLRVLTELDLLADSVVETGRTPTRVFECTGDPELFNRLAERIIGPRVEAVGRG